MRILGTLAAKLRSGHSIAILLLLVAAVVRIYAAWCLRNSPDSDYGIVCLMAKHMAEGHDYPIFFYGQAYMGSLEPAVSAVFCKLLGCSGFAVCLGTAFTALLALPFVYLLGSKAGGRTAGITALAYCVVGPQMAFYYQVLSRGGYGIALLFSTTVLWLTCNIAVEKKKRQNRAWGQMALLGLAAGLGWWSNQLIVSALLTSALVFLAVLKRKLMKWDLLAGVAGFLVGSLPFWIWNFQNNWQTFSFLNVFGEQNAVRGLSLFYENRLLQLFGFNDKPRIIAIAEMLTFAIIVFTGMAVILSRLHKPQFTDKSIFAATCVVFVLVSSLIFCRSRFATLNTSRYLVPIVPALAVMIGIAIAWLVERMPLGLGWCPLILIAALQLSVFPSLRRMALSDLERKHDAETLAAVLRDHNIEAVYTDYFHHFLNSALKEEFCFNALDWERERYKPYAVAAEISDRPAVLKDIGNFTYFLDATGGESMHDERFPELLFGFRPPPDNLVEVETGQWISATDASQKDIRGLIVDRNLDTAWQGTLEADRDCIQIALREPRAICGLRIINGKSIYPEEWQVSGRNGSDGQWIKLTDKLTRAIYFWSGPRPFRKNPFYRLECRFKPHTTDQILIELPRNTNWNVQWSVSEIQIFSLAEEPLPAPATVESLIDALNDRGIEYIYCDRWIANTLSRRPDCRARTAWNAQSLLTSNPNPVDPIVFRPGVALIAARENAPLCRGVLAQRDISMRETVIGRWVLFDFDMDTWRKEWQDDFGLVWAGVGCFVADNKRWAVTLVQYADRTIESENNKARAVELLRKAVTARPNYLPALERLARLFVETQQHGEAEEWKRKAERASRPDTVAEIEFENGIRFLGLSLEHPPALPGGVFSIRYFWRCPSDVRTDVLAVFVHFVGAEGRFQDDHVFLETEDVSFQPFPEVFVEERTVAVPPDAKTGDYEVQLGLCLRRPPGRRVPFTTELPSRKYAAQIPVTLTISK